MITDRDKLRCAMSEVAKRRHVYRRLVDQGKMKPHHADIEIKTMEAIAEDYRAKVKAEEPDLI